MIPPSFTTIDERSSFVVKRRMRSKSRTPGEEPAITILPPEPSLTAQFSRSPSPGVYKTAPTKASISKGPSSFVILGEMLSTPVQSRPASPSGRVSPFRGHGFKSPATSRVPSPDPSKPKKPELKKKPPPPTRIPKFKTDIGLPPKSPKKIKPPLRPARNTTVQKANLGIDKPKPTRTPKPNRKPLTIMNKKTGQSPSVPYKAPKPVDMDQVSLALSNLADDVKAEDVEDLAVEPSEPEPPYEEKNSAAEVEADGEKKEAESGEKEQAVAPISVVEPEKKESEKLIPCFQPDKCHIAPPTMASPSPIITSAINAPSTLTKPLESIETTQASTVTTTSLNALSTAVTVSGNLAKRIQPVKESGPTLAVPTSIETDSIQQQSPSPPSNTTAATHIKMPPHSQLSGAVAQNNKSSTNSVHNDVLSTSNLIKVDSELELLDANNLIDSPPRRQANPAWNEERLTNGDVPSVTGNRSKFRRFLTSVWAIIKYILCCRCVLDRCRRAGCCNSKCCRRGESQQKKCCPTGPCSCCSFCKRFTLFRSCCGCCGRSGCCKCKKPKCCEGSKCCKGKSKRPPPTQSNTKRKCCAKSNCSCKDCCASIRNSCSNCGDRVNKFCRFLFCLNRLWCQRCLRKCCKPCHKMKCCQAEGCCSCFNPSVKRPPKLDKRASTQSKTDKENLDPVLVEHVSLMKAAIPVLPTCLATFCLILNMVFPGSGTFMSGIFCLCFGKPRFSVKDTAKKRVGSFCVNFVIGIAQLFTIVFCLVGWGWSIWWGVIMYRLARKQRRIKLAEKSTQEAKNSANHNHVDVEKG